MGTLRIGNPLVIPLVADHSEGAAFRVEITTDAVNGRKEGHLVPRATSLLRLLLRLSRTDLLAGGQRPGEDVLHRVAVGIVPLGNGTPAVDVATEVEFGENDRRGPLLEGDLRRLGVPHHVVLAPFRCLAGHRVPTYHLLRHERTSIERGELIALRLQQTAPVRDESDGNHRHALVGRGGKRLAIDLVRVGRVVGVGVPHPLRILRRETDELLMPPPPGIAVRRPHHPPFLRATHRNVGTPVKGVEHLHGRDGRVIARAGADGKDLTLPFVCEGVQNSHRPHIIVVLHHIGVKNDFRRRGKQRDGTDPQ